MNVQSGVISLAGGHTLNNGTLNIGISNVTSFGTVSLSGAAALTGTLSANFNAGFLPAVSNSCPDNPPGMIIATLLGALCPSVAVGMQRDAFDAKTNAALLEFRGAIREMEATKRA